MEARVWHFPGVKSAGRVSSGGGGTEASSPSSPRSRPVQRHRETPHGGSAPRMAQVARNMGGPRGQQGCRPSALSCGHGGLGGTPTRPVDYLRPRGSVNSETAEPGSTKFWSDWDDGLSITGGKSTQRRGPCSVGPWGRNQRAFCHRVSLKKKKKRLGFLRKN